VESTSNKMQPYWHHCRLSRLTWCSCHQLSMFFYLLSHHSTWKRLQKWPTMSALWISLHHI